MAKTTKTTAPADPANGSSTTNAMVVGFKAARRASTPLVAIETPDPAQTINALVSALGSETPILAWDCVRGLNGLNELGADAFGTVGVSKDASLSPVETLAALEDNLPSGAVVIFSNFHRQMNDPMVVQGLWNLRDPFKGNKRMAVLLGPLFQLPAELSGDVIVLDEPLPTRESLNAVLDQQHVNANLQPPTDLKIRTAALDAIVGLPHYTAEQVTAMSITKQGINIGRLWERKTKAIENTPGLRVWKPKSTDTTIDELRGIDNVKNFMKKLVDADSFGAIVFIDEADKAFAGGMSDYTGDSGVSKDQVGTILSYIEDTQSLGVLLAGVAGTGKTQLAKATGALSGKPVIVFDLGGMKGGTVGQSEEQIRTALKVVTATAEGRVLFICTANRTTIFTPELNRRFPDQFFYDVPTADERAAIWPVYIAKNNLTGANAQFPEGMDEGYTGAEIKRVCERANLFKTSIADAAKYIIPASVSGKAAIAELRKAADSRFLSASKPGYFKIQESSSKSIHTEAKGSRQIELS